MKYYTVKCTQQNPSGSGNKLPKKIIIIKELENNVQLIKISKSKEQHMF